MRRMSDRGATWFPTPLSLSLYDLRSSRGVTMGIHSALALALEGMKGMEVGVNGVRLDLQEMGGMK